MKRYSEFWEVILERKLTKGEKISKESNVKKLKKHLDKFEDQYGKDGKSVMYAVATKRAKEKSKKK